ncbi:MAG: copper homeostasis protein CutC [Candidatus Cloacimonadota bacterium]|nr:MAG: copper homeostasis protein CutC [Candidatus Cloacimonadota bacterium]
MKLEICIASAKSAEIASEFAIDRLELNSGLELGGLTPDIALLDYIKSFSEIPVMCMIRPRPSGFCYNKSEFMMMRRSIDNFLSCGTDGIVIGFLKNNATIDREKCLEIRKAVPENIDLVFHRAFDFTEDLTESAKILEDCGFTRILTSGGEYSAVAGKEKIKKLIESFKHIEILPGAGINPENCLEFIKYTRAKQLHGTFSNCRRDLSTSGNKLNLTGFKDYDENSYLETSSEKLKSLIMKLKSDLGSKNVI